MPDLVRVLMVEDVADDAALIERELRRAGITGAARRVDSERAYREALQIFAELGHRRGIARALEGFACLAAARGQAARALQLAGAATLLRHQLGAPLPQAEQNKIDQSLSGARASLSEPEGKDASTAGSAMSLEQAIQYSLEEQPPVS